MSQGAKCHQHDESFFRRDHVNHNHSAFNGYHVTWSPYTEVVCTAPVDYSSGPGICGHRWRSRAAWVDKLPLLKKGDDIAYPDREACT